jgi:molybdate transport system substrate-binding protein
MTQEPRGRAACGFGRLKCCATKVALVFVMTVFPLSAVAQQPRELIVSAAASLTNAFRHVGKTFEAKQKGVRVNLNFAASGDLLRQIEGGAPVDVFASAAPREMDQLEAKGLIVPGTRRDFVENGLVLIRPVVSSAKIVSFDDLKKGEIKKIAVGNPATVPAGMYAQQVLTYFKVWDDVKGKLVFGESVRQVLDYVVRGEVEAGLVFSTDASARSKEVLVAVRSPAESHSPIVYPIAVVKDTKNGDLAKAFVQFVVSPEGQKILKAYGFKSSR